MDVLIQIIIDFWVIAVLMVGIVLAVYKFIKLSNIKQSIMIRKWLYHACILAERDLGSDNGKKKLHYVYDMFTRKFKWISILITFEQFSAMVEDTLHTIENELKGIDK